jgi:malic enzyme
MSLRSEIDAHDAYEFSHNKALFASGSPYLPVKVEGRCQVPTQANNVLTFPGVRGLLGLDVLSQPSDA